MPDDPANAPHWMSVPAWGVAFLLCLAGCNNARLPEDSEGAVPMNGADGGRALAQVIEVTTTGSSGNYTFAVTVSSPDTGCSQYADWWEVVAADESLAYRRILLHSHVGEQPFTRTGGPVPVAPPDEVTVRVHMNTSGYSPQAQRGSIDQGFEAVELPDDFAAGLEAEAPLPDGCDF